MKGYAMLKIGESGWIEKERPVCGPLDAICRPLAVAICTSDVHTLWEGAIGERHNMILGHECCAEVVEVGELVKDFKPGDRVLVPAITPDWNSLKTDNTELFNFSLEQIREYGWTVLSYTYDLHHHEEMNKGNIMTEYEEKFSAKGNPINKLIAGRGTETPTE